MKGRKPFRIVVAEPFASAAMDKLRTVGEVTELTDASPQSLIQALGDADALLIRSKAHVTARIIDAAPKLRVIARASSTIDHIDLRAAKRREIPVVYCPDAAVESTAEFAFAMILALQRRILYFDSQVRAGSFDTVRQPVGGSMKRSLVGFLGVDAVARRLGQLLYRAFDQRIIFHEPVDPSSDVPPGWQRVSLDDLLTTCDVLTIHLKLQPATRLFMNAARLAQMKPSALLINVTRGVLVDTIALADALKQGALRGAALDVFETEPLPASHPIRQAPNCILTPHVAGATEDAAEERYNVADDVIRVLTGETPRYPVSLP